MGRRASESAEGSFFVKMLDFNSISYRKMYLLENKDLVVTCYPINISPYTPGTEETPIRIEFIIMSDFVSDVEFIDVPEDSIAPPPADDVEFTVTKDGCTYTVSVDPVV